PTANHRNQGGLANSVPGGNRQVQRLKRSLRVQVFADYIKDFPLPLTRSGGVFEFAFQPREGVHRITHRVRREGADILPQQLLRIHRGACVPSKWRWPTKCSTRPYAPSLPSRHTSADLVARRVLTAHQNAACSSPRPQNL